jgi:hypothetical protein
VSGEHVLDFGALTMTGANYGGSFSQSLAFVGDMTGDGLPDIAVGARYEDWGAEYTGGVHVIDGVTRGNFQAPLGVYALVQGEIADALVGESIAPLGDLNNDGLSELLIGSWSEAKTSAWILFGGTEGRRNVSDLPIAIVADEIGDRAGQVVTGLGDTDGDGLPDFALGMALDDLAGANSGAVYVFLGFDDGVRLMSEADALLTGEVTGAQAGSALDAAGDVNGDGYEDMLIGAPKDDQAFERGGAAYIVLGPFGTGSLAGAWVEIHGSSRGDEIGWCVSRAGDIDGDGKSDMLIGAPFATTHDIPYNGSLWILTGVEGGDYAVDGIGTEIYGMDNSEFTGEACAPGGDVNGDGLAEVFGGSLQIKNQDDVTVGAGWLFYSPFPGVASRDQADVHLYGVYQYEHAGSTVAGGWDIDADGYDDLLIGAQLGGNDYQGAAYLWLGGPEDIE